MVKLKHATQLLSDSGITVSEVAFQLGFTDLKYFRICFKEKYGMLPSEYHKKYQKAKNNSSDINSFMDF